MAVDERERVRAANPLEHVIPSLTGHPTKRHGKEYLTICPYHDDKNPSLRINPEKQTWFCDPCNEGGDVFTFVEKFRHVEFDAALAELAKHAAEPKRAPATHLAAEYVYQAADGIPVNLVRRYESDEPDPVTGKPHKEFRQFRRDDAGEWIAGTNGHPLPVYRLPTLHGQRVVYWPEGERCADALAAQGFAATTSPGGAMKVTAEHVAQVQHAGVQHVVVLPDNDEVGRAHGRKVAELCRRAGLRVKVCQLPELPLKGDCIDWFAAGHTAEDLRAVVKTTPLYDPHQETGAFGADQYDWRVLDGCGYELDIPRLGIHMRIVDVRRHSNGSVTGVLTVHVEFSGAKVIPLTGGIINSAEINVASDVTRRQRAKHLAERACTGDEIDWIGLMDMFCVKVIDAEASGSAAIPLQQVRVSDTASELLVGPVGYPILRNQSSLWFADGGSGKTTQAIILGVELVRMGINVLLADFEGAEDQHKQTYDKIVGPNPPDAARLAGFVYRRFERPFVHEVTRIRDEIAKHHIGFVIVDSVGFAADGSPESSDAATAFFRALRAIGTVGSLLIAHVNRSEQGDQRPFGSVFWGNGARNMWYLKRSDVDMNEHEFTVGFFHRKANFGPLRPPFGVRLTFAPDRISVARANLGEITELATKLPVWQRIKQYLEQSGMPVNEELISEHLEVPAPLVRKAVGRFTNTFYKEQDGRVGLRLVATGGEVF